MLSFFYHLLLVSLLSVNGSANECNSKVTCGELGLSFTLPAGFASLDSAQMNALEQRGKKAIKESFDREPLQGWQPACVNVQDSFKRTVIATSISAKEAIDLNGSVEKFMAATFKDANDFTIQRIKRRVDIPIDEGETIKQSDITIAGLKAKKNAFTLTYGGRLLFYSRYYFFQKAGRLYLLNFTGSPKASDNEEIAKAIESAKPL